MAETALGFAINDSTCTYIMNRMSLLVTSRYFDLLLDIYNTFGQIPQHREYLSFECPWTSWDLLGSTMILVWDLVLQVHIVEQWWCFLFPYLVKPLSCLATWFTRVLGPYITFWRGHYSAPRIRCPSQIRSELREPIPWLSPQKQMPM